MARIVELTVEDGTGVAGANSFVTEAQIVAHAASRGASIPSASDAELDAVAVLGIKAMDYLALLPWLGEPITVDQQTPWPRKGTSYSETAIPNAVKQAQLQLAVMVFAGTDLTPVSGGLIVEETVGPIKTKYSEEYGFNANGLPFFPGIAALLSGWLIADTTLDVTGPLLFSLGGCDDS